MFYHLIDVFSGFSGKYTALANNTSLLRVHLNISSILLCKPSNLHRKEPKISFRVIPCIISSFNFYRLPSIALFLEMFSQVIAFELNYTNQAIVIITLLKRIPRIFALLIDSVTAANDVLSRVSANRLPNSSFEHSFLASSNVFSYCGVK